MKKQAERTMQAERDELLDPKTTRTLIESARDDVRDSSAESGHTVAAYADAMRGRDLTLDDVIKKVSAERGPDGRWIQCRKGCAHCCHQLVLTSPIEVMRIARHVVEYWNPVALAALMLRLDAIAAIPATEDDRTSRKLPCPLLENGACQVYELRPVNCRALLSYSEKDCSDGLDKSTRTRGDSGLVPSPDLPFIVGAALDIGLDAGQIEKGLDTERIDLVRGLKIALEQKDAGERWLAGEPVFAPARLPTPMRNADLVKAGLEHLGIAKAGTLPAAD